MRTKLILSILLLAGLLLTACGAPAGSKFEPIMNAAPTMVAAEMPAAAPNQPPQSDQSSAAAKSASGPAAPADSAGNAPVTVPAAQTGRMILKDGLLELLVTDTDVAVQRMTQLAADEGGYIVSARTWMEGPYKRAELHLGVPSSQFEVTMNALKAMGIKVLNEQASGQDVSAEYTDLKSRLGNLEATAARVRGFLDNAKTVEESLQINQTLSDLEGQIEQVKGQMKFYETRAAYSTIAVMLSPEMPTPTPTPTPTPKPGWNPGHTVQSAWDVMIQLIRGTIDLLIWVIFLGWPFLVVALVIWWAVRRYNRRKAK